MCGIAGIFHLDGEPIDPSILKAMADTLAHRGPDDEGFYFNHPQVSEYQHPSAITPQPRSMSHKLSTMSHIGLAHRRLSIIDLSSGHQPMSNEDGTVWIVFNGEIYNFPSLRNDLVSKGHIFKTRSDTETIVHAYEEWGEACVDRLRGMFAFAIWDGRRQRLFLARDRLGIKPLYYYWDGKRLLFGSELKAILAYPRVRRDLNLQALYDYFCLLYIPAPKSIFKNIFKLPAGHTLTIGQNCQPQVQEYWDISFDPEESVSEQEWCERIIEKLQESVKIRLMSDVPLGAFLSGGIDSSAVVAMMSDILDGPVKTSSVGFNEDRFNELPYARSLVERYGTDHQEVVVNADGVDVLDRLVWHFDEPFADSSSVPTYYVSKLTKQKVTVALSGDGGDENFAGYRRYYFDLLENRLRGLFPHSFRTTIVAFLAKQYPKADWLPQVFRAKTLLTNLAMSPMEGYYNSMSWFGQYKDRIMAPDICEEIRGYSPAELFAVYGDASKTRDPLSRIQYIDVKTYLVDDILTKVDRASMATSLEVRVPLLDHEFMELVAKIPSRLKLRNKEGKYIFKKALEPYVTEEILHRRKLGFSIPLKDWFRGSLTDRFHSLVLSGRGAACDYLNMATVERLWKGHQTGTSDFSSELWAILFFAAWADRFLD